MIPVCVLYDYRYPGYMYLFVRKVIRISYITRAIFLTHDSYGLRVLSLPTTVSLCVGALVTGLSVRSMKNPF